MTDRKPEIKMVSRVTIEQGRTFADSWIERIRQSEASDEAFAAARVMVWPENNPEAQARFHAITDDMFGRFWTAIREPTARAFVEAANHVVSGLAVAGRNAMKDRQPKIETVDEVTIEHGLAFAQGWYEGDMTDACDDTGIMTWPDGGVEMKETQLRFHNLADEICANVFGLTKRQIAEAFVRAANEVLDREKAMNGSFSGVPIAAFTEAMTNEVLAINGLHVLTFKPAGNWTVITLRNGDTVTVTTRFDDVLAALSATH